MHQLQARSCEWVCVKIGGRFKLWSSPWHPFKRTLQTKEMPISRDLENPQLVTTKRNTVNGTKWMRAVCVPYFQLGSRNKCHAETTILGVPLCRFMHPHASSSGRLRRRSTWRRSKCSINWALVSVPATRFSTGSAAGRPLPSSEASAGRGKEPEIRDANVGVCF